MIHHVNQATVYTFSPICYDDNANDVKCIFINEMTCHGTRK